MHEKLSELGATPLTEFAYGDVGSPVWERLHADWNTRVWPILLELSGARPTRAAAERVAAEGGHGRADEYRLEHGDAGRLPVGQDVATQPIARSMSVPSIVGVVSPRADVGPKPRPVAGAAGPDDPHERRREGHRSRHASWPAANSRPPSRRSGRGSCDLSQPPGVAYRVGDHLGICPKNDEERVEQLARHLGAELDSLFMAPKTMNVRAVPKGVIQVRNVLTNLIDITGRPTVPLLDLLLEKAADPAEQYQLEIRDVLQTPDGPDSALRAAIDAAGYGVLRLLDEFPSCSLNIFEFLRVAQPLRPRYYSTSSSPKECSITFTWPRRASGRAAGPTSRTGSASRARSSGACSPPTATCTSAVRSQCATPSAPPSPTWSRNTGRCRASAPRPTWTSWRRPHATAQTSGLAPTGPAWTPLPLS